MNEIMIIKNEIPTFSNKALQTATNKVFKIGETVRKCAFETAYIMAQVESTECYKDDGFDSVHDWAMKTFGFKKSASYTLLRVGKEYTRAITDGNGKVKGFGSNLVADGENDFTTSQVEKMLPGGRDLAGELVDDGEITANMTCKEIEKVIKAHTQPENTEEETENKQAEEESENEVERVIVCVVDITDGGNIEAVHGDTMYSIPLDILEKYKV